MQEKRMLTTGEIAKYVGVNFRTVIRWIERGHLKSFKLPGRGDNRITIAGFMEFLRAFEMPIPEEFQNTSRRVLIVEDDLAMANAIQRTLRRANLETMIASDGFKAGAMLGTFSPMVATLDLMLPGLGGLEVLKFVRSSESLRDLKILVVSAMPQNDLDAALAAGADDILSKPFQNEELVEKVLNLAEIEAGA